MRRSIRVLAGLLAWGCVQARAADLRPAIYEDGPGPGVILPLDWSGPYIGVQFGGVLGYDQLTPMYDGQSLPRYNFATSMQPRGAVGGVHVGQNFQLGYAVYGVEADIEGARLRGTLTTSDQVNYPGYEIHLATKFDWQGSVNIRGGLLVGDAGLVYATAGLAFARIDNYYGLYLPPPDTGVRTFYDATVSHTRYGLNVGTGFEYMFARGLTARIEYRFADFGSHQDQIAYLPSAAARHELLTHTLRIGATFHL